MSAAPINYDALAQQHGGATANVDYDALAAHHGAVTDQKGFGQSFADSSGISSLAHPIDTLMGIPAGIKKMALDSVSNVKQGVADYQKEGLSDTTRRDFGRAVPILGPALAQAQAQHDSGDNAGMAGTLAGTVVGLAAPAGVEGAAAKLAKLAPKVAGILDAAGDTAQGGANKLINETVGSYKGDFKRGANPGRGYNTAVAEPSLTMRSFANKVEDVQNEVGQNIQKVIADSTAKDTLIPAQTVADALRKPLQDAHDAELAPGGMGNTEPFQKYAANFRSTMQSGFEKGGFTPQEVFDLKKTIAQKAKFNNTTPEGVLEVRQQQVGALGGVLTDVLPELKGLNQQYQDLVPLGLRAKWRAESGSLPLNRAFRKGITGGLFEVGEVPAMTTAATILNKVGGGLKSAADKFGGASEDGASGIGGPIGNDVPSLSSGSVSGQASAWAAKGSENLIAHGLPESTVKAVGETSWGKQLLMRASSLSPGSKAMAALAAQIASQTAKDDGRDK